MDETPAEERFHENVLGLSDLMYDLVDDVHTRGYKTVSPAVITLIKTILQKYSKIKIIDAFIKYSYEHWDQIRSGDESYFIDHAGDIFKDLPINHVNTFKELFLLKDDSGNNVVPKEDRDAIREFFISFIKIAINYIHVNRGPVIWVSPENEEIKAYRKQEFFSDVPLEHHADAWDVKLTFHDRVTS